ncbi:MAG TPA: hypothetical protein VGX78_01215 [Pirellulales bacterium]|jgi:hypothetical protein|nr:hypothetical protein [Pirellulales bacterium]
MKGWLRKLATPVRQWLRDRHERRLALLRAQVALALADEFRSLAGAQERSQRQLAELSLFVEGLAREILRLQRQVDERVESGV